MILTRTTCMTFALFLCVPVAVEAGKGKAAEGGSRTIGKNPGETKGRWLRIEDEAALRAAERVAIQEVTTDIHWKKAEKETPIDERILADKVREQLLEGLQGSFPRVSAGELPQDAEGLRLHCDLLVEPGNRAVRYLVGFGAGKSKSILTIEFRDNRSDELVALYHGYGVGSGMAFKLAGGGARKMTQDDIQENAKVLADLLRKVR